MLGLDVCKNKQYLIDDLENTFFCIPLRIRFVKENKFGFIRIKFK